MIKVFLIIAVIIQTVATVYALRLVRATKYNAVWILFIIGFSLLSVERIVQVMVVNGGVGIPHDTFSWLGVVISICMSIGVMYAHKLIRYIDRLNRQRQLMQKRILTAVLRTEEKSRSQFSKELHDGLGPLLSSAKMSLSARSSTTRPTSSTRRSARCAKFRTTFRRRCSTISDWRAASRTSSRAARRCTACASASRPTCARNGSTPTSR